MSTNQETREARCPKCGETEHPMVPAPCRYNGWKNYETWAVNLWIGNDEGSYSYWREAAKETYPTRTAAGILAERLKDEITEAAGDRLDADKGGMFSDLLGAALDSVDWYEIAEEMLED